METRKKSGDFRLDKRKKGDFHVLVRASTGFQMLDIYGDLYGVPRRDIHDFVKEVNERDEPGTLLPYPISAIPRKYVLDNEDAPALTGMINHFLEGYTKTTPATCLLLDFRNWVYPWTVEAMEESLKSPAAQSLAWIFMVTGRIPPG